MCGIAGLLGFRDALSAKTRVTSMANALLHRGPDDSSEWIGDGIALAHRRLSVLDLSYAGRQPMHSANQRYVLVFNGEIYNHNQLREQIGDVSWRGTSDTETLLAAINEWGLEKTLPKLTGMFAFALWDKEKRELMLARDRLGEKPLYYGWIGKEFVFSSELKSLRTHPSWSREIDREALSSYMNFGYVPAPFSIFTGIKKLLPGTYLKILDINSSSTKIDPVHYWRALDVAMQSPLPISDEVAVDRLESLLTQSVKRQMLSDVPIGAFLSGGIDSSTVVALMQSQTSSPIRTFSIGFIEEEHDEAVHAKAVASHIGTIHTELYVTPNDAIDVIPNLPSVYDEPFGDSSAIPTCILAEMTKSHVTVALSGDGGDELFGGYNRHFFGEAIWKKIRYFPLSSRYILGKAITAISPTLWDLLVNPVKGLIPSKLPQSDIGDKLHKFAGIIDAKSSQDIYHRLISQAREKEDIVIGAASCLSWAQVEAKHFCKENFIEKMMFQDLVSYLSDDILVKVDRAAMMSSLETRIPMLDHDLIKFAWALPIEKKVRSGQGKWLLRQVLDRHVPKALTDRPKKGFGVPLNAWLRGPLRDWAETLLDERRICAEGLLNAQLIRLKWEEHLSGKRNWHQWLWNVLMFQAWLENNK
ncbi:MAG: asparagine synthase (glutamine-hydrolyzing) [Burkholderiales bacterium]|nr:asparagine synthase (glutamine-hydrolyzing) [Burkholderiales bacterium]